MTKDEMYETALRRADEKLGFYIHLAVYMIINGLLAAINLIFSPSILWFKYPALGWGLGLLIHAFIVFVITGLDLRGRLLERELRRLRLLDEIDAVAPELPHSSGIRR